jgi:hypothetical protein
MKAPPSPPEGPLLPVADIKTIWVPRWVLDRTWTFLRQDGLKNVESTVLWGGRRFGDDAVVMAALYPCGRDVSFSHGLIRVGPDTSAEIGRWLRAQGLRALVQVHTHPGAWTGHSKTDDEGPIVSSEGFVSVVWPRYAAQPVQTVRDLGVHRLLGGGWHGLHGRDAETLLRLVESEGMIWAPNATAGLGEEEERR